MNPQTLSTICSQVYQRFPEVAGSQPREQTQPGEKTLLIFSGQTYTEGGHKIQRTVRVIVSSQGKIIKMTTSR